jgi:adenylate cyclase
MAESLDPAELVQTMNEFFGKMVDCVFGQGGTLDKFIGDSVMAFWGAPVSHPDDCLRAVRCALDMQSILLQLNDLRQKRNLPRLEVGIGLHAGEAVVGNVGSDKRMEYTALGSTVNLSSRIQGHSTGGQILVSEQLFALLRGAASGTWLDAVKLRGVKAPVRLFSLTSLAGHTRLDDDQATVRSNDATRDAPGTP